MTENETVENETLSAPDAPQVGACVSFGASSFLSSAPAALQAWIQDTHQVMERHWGQALERARTRLDSPKVSAEAAEDVAERAVESTPKQTPLHALFSSALATRAQEHGATILLGSMRKIRTQLETLEANLEAARPKPEPSLG